MSTPPVPQEVVDIIIDCAWEMYCESRNGRTNPGAHRSVNGAAFNVLALVSRSWVARARHCAFRDLTPRRNWDPYAHWLQSTGTLLGHPLCTIREHVLRLHCGGEVNGNTTIWIHDIADVSYLQSFPNLKSLHLYALFSVPDWMRDITVFERLLPTTLENLELEKSTFPNMARLLDLIASATGLRSLKCANLLLRGGDSGPSTSVHSSPHVQPLTKLSVTVADYACRQVLEWISSAPVPPRIADLELQAISAHHVAVVSRALQVLGPSVVTLSLMLMTMSDFNQTPLDTADLSTLENLRHLVIACSFNPHDLMGIDVPSILARLAENCKTVQSITFRILELSDEDDGLFTAPWEAIVTTLNGPSFRQLERIVLQLPPPPWQDEWPDAAWDLLKKRVGQQLRGNVTLVCLSDGDWSSS